MNFENLKKNTTAIVAIFILTLSYAILFTIIFWDFNQFQKDIYFTIAGGVTSIVTMVVSYYFGSSKNPNDENPIK
jgi:putative effector of murein hydrolase